MTDAPATEPLEVAPLATPSREHAFRDVFVQVVARVLNLALGIVVTILVVRILGDSGYGQWMTILTTFQLVGFFTSLGLESVAVREAVARGLTDVVCDTPLIVMLTALRLADDGGPTRSERLSDG